MCRPHPHTRAMARDLIALQAALASYLPYGSAITGIRQAAHGLSNGTYYLDGVDRVLRMPPDEDGLLPPYELGPAVRDLPARCSSWGAPPVPEVSEYCDDESIVARPFTPWRGFLVRRSTATVSRNGSPRTRPRVTLFAARGWRPSRRCTRCRSQRSKDSRPVAGSPMRRSTGSTRPRRSQRRS